MFLFGFFLLLLFFVFFIGQYISLHLNRGPALHACHHMQLPPNPPPLSPRFPPSRSVSRTTTRCKWRRWKRRCSATGARALLCSTPRPPRSMPSPGAYSPKAAFPSSPFSPVPVCHQCRHANANSCQHLLDPSLVGSHCCQRYWPPRSCVWRVFVCWRCGLRSSPAIRHWLRHSSPMTPGRCAFFFWRGGVHLCCV